VTGPVAVRDVARISGPEGKEVFAEMKGLNLFQNKVGGGVAGVGEAGGWGRGLHLGGGISSGLM
jgi:hypothetical protein